MVDMPSKVQIERDHWAGEIFIHYGKGWITGIDCQRYCIGPVDFFGNPVRDDPPTPTETSLNGTDNVSKLVINTKLLVQQDTGTNGGVVLKHAGGRKRKEDGQEMSRITRWRRKKEQQGEFLL